MFADTLVKQAYDDWINVVEYDGKGLLKFKQKKKSVTTRSDAANVSTSYTYDSAHSQKQLARGHANANIERSLMSSTSKGICFLPLVAQDTFSECFWCTLHISHAS